LSAVAYRWFHICRSKHISRQNIIHHWNKW